MGRPSRSLRADVPHEGSRFPLVIVALFFALVPMPVGASDEKEFPTDREELDDWFPADERDADPLSDPTPPGPIQGKSTPPTLQEQAESGRTTGRPVDRRTLDERFTDVRKVYGPLLREIEAALAKPVGPVLPPPDYELECNDDPAVGVTTEQLVQAYVKQAAQPELDLLTRLLDVRRQMQLLGVRPLETHQAELAGRLMTKARELVARYGQDRNKVLAILAFLHKAQEVSAFVGDGVSQSLFAETAAWLNGLIPPLLDEIRSKHDYRAVSAVLALAQLVINAGQGSAGIDPEAILRRIEAALGFELRLELYVVSTGANGEREDWRLENTIPMKPQVSKGATSSVPRIVLEGEGSGRYASYRDYGGDITMTAPGFDTIARVVEFDACVGTAKLVFDRFFADEETYHFPKTGGSPAPLPMIHSLFHGILDLDVVGDGYRFEVPVRNLTPKAVDTVIAQSRGVFATEFTVKLTHRPK